METAAGRYREMKAKVAAANRSPQPNEKNSYNAPATETVHLIDDARRAVLVLNVGLNRIPSFREQSDQLVRRELVDLASHQLADAGLTHP